MMEREPLPWLGELMFSFIVLSMKRMDRPAIDGAFDGEDRSWPKEWLMITDLGRAVLAGEVDWLSLHPPARWVGGAYIPGAAPCWRWDKGTAAVVRR